MALIQMSFMAGSLSRYTDLSVYLPLDPQAGMDRAPRPRFRTLYLLHGYGGSDMDWVVNSRLVPLARRYGLAVVMPEGDNSFYLDFPERTENYHTFISRELVDFTRKVFPLSDKREDTFIGGLSMGDGAAVRACFEDGDVFSKAAALSPGLMLGEETKRLGHNSDLYELYLQAKENKKEISQLMITIGDRDPQLWMSRQFHAFLVKEGMDHRYEEGPGAHDWDFWDGHLEEVLAWLTQGGVS